MTPYKRIFGTGPRGALISVMVLALLYAFEEEIGLTAIHGNPVFGIWAFAVLSAVTLAIVVWSLVSLPPMARGKALVTRGAFRYFRHPLYAAFLSAGDFGLALWLDNWTYLIWAVLLHPLWHWNIGAEEALMQEEFGGEYTAYSARTGRFVPRLPWRGHG